MPRSTLDLSAFEVIDVHTHMPAEVTPGDSQREQNLGFVDALLSREELANREEARKRILSKSDMHFWRNPRVVQLINFMSRENGGPPTVEATDAVVAPHIGKDFSGYIRTVMDRAKIRSILLQSNDLAPVRPKSLVPDDRFEWSYNIGPVIQPAWAKQQGIRTLADWKEAIDGIVDQCAANGCRGFKVPIAYYRAIAVHAITAADAESNMKRALALDGTTDGSAERQAEFEAARSAYQDYLLKQLYIRAGQAGLRIIIHSAVGLHPALRFDWNDPRGLYEMFRDEDVLRAGTQFVIIHTGYPEHHHVAGFLSQFPHVYTDVSFCCQYPGALEEVLRAFLGVAPSEKILFGSDGSVADRWAMCADSVRRVLSKVLSEYHQYYGWSMSECERAARNVMSENARRVYGF